MKPNQPSNQSPESPKPAARRSLVTPRRVLLGIAFAVLACVLILWLRYEPEPRYGGRALSAWVEAYLSLEDHAPEAGQTVSAIKHIAAANLPELVQWVAYDPVPRARKAAAIARRIPTSLRRPFMPALVLDKKAFRSNTAVTALCLLGPDAHPALPELAALSRRTNATEVSRRALWILAHMGKAGMPLLLEAARDPRHPNRVNAIRHLTEFGAQALEAKPLLEELTRDPDPKVGAAALGTLHLLTNTPPQK